MTLSAAAPYPIIDSHVHVWKHDPEFPFAPEAKNVPPVDRTPEALLALMKANDVKKTVIIQVIHYRYDNSYLLSVLKRFPDTFRGVGRVDPLNPAAPDHLSKMAEQGLKGVRLSPAADASGDWIRGDLMQPLWKRCEELKIPMTILAPVTRMPDIGRLIDHYPDLTLVIDHMADCPIDQPAELDRLIALKRHPKTFIKISHAWALSKQKYPWTDVHEQIKRLHHEYGPQRLMWATDFPILENSGAHYSQALTLVRDELPFLNAEDKSWMLSKSVEQVWPFS